MEQITPKEKAKELFEKFYENYLINPNKGYADLYGNKITDKEYLLRIWNEDRITKKDL